MTVLIEPHTSSPGEHDDDNAASSGAVQLSPRRTALAGCCSAGVNLQFGKELSTWRETVRGLSTEIESYLDGGLPCRHQMHTSSSLVALRKQVELRRVMLDEQHPRIRHPRIGTIHAREITSSRQKHWQSTVGTIPLDQARAVTAI